MCLQHSWGRCCSSKFGKLVEPLTDSPSQVKDIVVDQALCVVVVIGFRRPLILQVIQLRSVPPVWQTHNKVLPKSVTNLAIHEVGNSIKDATTQENLVRLPQQVGLLSRFLIVPFLLKFLVMPCKPLWIWALRKMEQCTVADFIVNQQLAVVVHQSIDVCRSNQLLLGHRDADNSLKKLLEISPWRRTSTLQPINTRRRTHLL
mmetsp:Transcript_31509/g.57248  ORF Transcript_31509/g.57248 Transcript_31509/m.57248 type:complete len:203 (-) Transcript_31509:162-770(-)